ncbi:MAG: type II secretion system F family protein, partial [Armatimonadetes bacterium]|nr:type II secretion system F family protein [Armatimonadota bacterium]NIM22803.1 type II secretion system F family protein [Armatimonadota bacterium]NIM66670.1 type II secretion system F family protein [Armatimonadota bacterium]NIM75227.1 type II secretion system F family protein [Armatimonadota bacterium]NIN04868.1 type II secretion system F family protein [Armatimonadota bacterium]
MATYNYVARDSLGKTVSGTSEAENEQMLVRRLRERGFWVQKVTAAKGQEAPTPGQAGAPKGSTGVSSIFMRVKGRDLAIFCRQFATMVNAGVSLIRSLTVLEEQSPSPVLQEIIRDVQANIEAGETLWRAMSRWPKVFTSLFVGLIKAGETGGVLDETLARLAQFLEDDQRLRRKVRSAMTYPVLVLIFAIIVVIGLVTFILPKFMEIFEELGISSDLPAATQLLMQFSNLLTTKWWLFIIIVVAVTAAIAQYRSTKIGKRHFDWLKLKLPVFGKLNHKIALSRFSRTLATLLVSGVPILQAMETVAGTLDNEIVGDAVMGARAAVREGEPIGDPLARSGLFPPMVVQMIGIGEETGALDQMLSKVADFYESEVDATLESLTAALEPVMIVMLGVVVGFIVIAMFLPLINAVSQLSSGGTDLE